MKILIADLHPEVQSALHLIVSRIDAVTEVSMANNLVQLLASCARSCPDLILFDLDLVHSARSRSQNLTDLIHVLRRLCPRSKLVVLSSRFEAEQEAQAAGADGFISKTDLPDMVLAAIGRLLAVHS